MEPDVQQPQQPVNQEPVQQQIPQIASTKFPLPKILFSVLGAVIVLSLIGGAYYLGTQKSSTVVSNEKTAVVTPKTVTAVPTSIVTQTSDATANWKTYTNTQQGFNFKYPENIFSYTSIVTSNPFEVYFGSKARLTKLQDSDMYLYISVLPNSSKTLDQLMQEQIQTTGDGEGTGEKTIIGGLLGYTITFDQPLGQTGAYSYQSVVLKGQNKYTIDFFTQSKDTLAQNKSLYLQLLSTFKFIN